MPAHAICYEDDRLRRRDRTCIATGLLMGAGAGVFAGIFAAPNALALSIVGAMAGAAIGALAASHLSPDDWDPGCHQRPYVGANSPDDDIAS